MKKILLTMLCVLPGVVFSTPTAEVRLTDAVEIEAPSIELGEIATIACDDPELRDRLVKLEVSSAPNPGNPRIISSYKVKGILDSAGLLEQCTVMGIQSTVSLAVRPVDDDEIIERISAWIDASMVEGTEPEIDYVKLPPRWHVPSGEAVKITVDPVGSRRVGTISFVLRASANGQVLTSTRANIHVSLFRESPVLIRPVQRGEIVTSEHVDYQRANVTKATGMEVAKLENVLGLAAKRDLPIGTLLSVDHLVKPILVKRGSLNSIQVRNGPVQLSITGAEALQDGREGELVMFSNPMNRHQPLKARVLGDGQAIIELR